MTIMSSAVGLPPDLSHILLLCGFGTLSFLRHRCRPHLPRNGARQCLPRCGRPHPRGARQHVSTIYELSIAEQRAIWELVGEVRQRLLTGLKPFYAIDPHGLQAQTAEPMPPTSDEQIQFMVNIQRVAG
jgi:hypothetical protein